MSANEASFGGSVPELYHRLLVPLLFEEYAEDLVSRVKVPAHGSVLETACGTVVVTRVLRKNLPAGVSLVATDLSPPMLEVAQKQLKDLPGITFKPADATALPFEDASFDTVLCQFGAMFFPDKGKGYREAARVLKPGGSFLFNVWDSLAQNPIPDGIAKAVARLTPDNPADFLGKTPYGYYNKDAIEAELKASGFAQVDSFVLKKTSRAPNPRDAALAFTAGTPLAAQLAERGITDKANAAAEQALRDQFGDGAVSTQMQAIIFVARKAG
jgi:SAM-dependent methyltransferase